ncbi:MAG: tRNA pseudouridine(38-40) synthase TruA [Rhodobacteraceae bacterium]|nr:tRNA pseudouridine(38-40) synthase TruA [Paracoccaceae bacterium]
MPVFALKIEYTGTGFAGWQRQKARPSVQAALEDAVAQVEPGRPAVLGAGRTDAGVHAHGQVAHVHCARGWNPFRLMQALNHHLKPAAIAIIDAAAVPEAFHARFSAVNRTYLFRLVTRRAPVTLDRGRVWQVPRVLDLAAMRAGAAYLAGTHDFTTFRSARCQAASPVKTVDTVQVNRHPYPQGTEFRFHVRARSFLHNQVRSFVGTLERVGTGGWRPEDVKAALEARDRAACGPVCPPEGLYLHSVHYNPDPFGQGVAG